MVADVPCSGGPCASQGRQVGALALGRSPGGAGRLEAKDLTTLVRPGVHVFGVRLPPRWTLVGSWDARAHERAAMMAFEAKCPLKEVDVLLWARKAQPFSHL